MSGVEDLITSISAACTDLGLASVSSNLTREALPRGVNFVSSGETLNEAANRTSHV